ncbi:hypothetical protein [Halorubrum sp. Ea8]|uniref:hypothetical protein n=1 Tax=Halorubrum sp. Ea8 TaxID=1383841 RepID=UPI001C3C83B7|nr:hypothetical protein [Halorubrum sp. Ea8]
MTVSQFGGYIHPEWFASLSIPTAHRMVHVFVETTPTAALVFTLFYVEFEYESHVLELRLATR